jgi:hypothetical protein
VKMLTWERIRDGEHNGRPCYEYKAQSGEREYHIVWAYDRGGSFGYTARNAEGYIDRYGIVWARTLINCKAACEKIEKEQRYGK